MILDPDRVLFQPLVAVELEMIMVVIGVAVVLMHDILAEQMVGDGVTGFAILGHSNPLRRRNARICRMRAPLALSHGAFALVKAQSI
jgi:hypothetical protein